MSNRKANSPALIVTNQEENLKKIVVLLLKATSIGLKLSIKKCIDEEMYEFAGEVKWIDDFLIEFIEFIEREVCHG